MVRIHHNPLETYVSKIVHLIFFIMSTKLLALAADLVDTNPAGSQLILSLTKAESGSEIMEALNVYDDELNYETYNVYEDDDDYVNPDEEDSVVSEENLVTV